MILIVERNCSIKGIYVELDDTEQIWLFLKALEASLEQVWIGIFGRKG